MDYALTPLGRSLAEALEPLCAWGSENMAEVSRIFAERGAWREGKTVQAEQQAPPPLTPLS